MNGAERQRGDLGADDLERAGDHRAIVTSGNARDRRSDFHRHARRCRRCRSRRRNRCYNRRPASRSQSQSRRRRTEIMLPTERLSYSAISKRPQLKLPNGARMAVWVIVNVEEWDPKQTMPRTVLTPPGRRLADARHSELVLARIRQPRRLLAHPESVRRLQATGRARDQRQRHRGLSADRRGRHRAQLGIHGSWIHPAQHAEGRGRARRYPARPTRPSTRPPASRRAAGSDRA